MKKSSPSDQFLNRLMILTLALLLTAGGVGLTTVWLRQQIFASANAIDDTERRLTVVDRRLADFNARVAAALSPEELLRRNRELDLGLALPREMQVVRVGEEVEVRLARKLNQELYSYEEPFPTGFVAFQPSPPATP